MSLPGNLYVITAPSGAGKSSLVNALLAQDPHLSLSISHTTRAPRGKEANGKEYWFTDVDHFKQMIESNEFIEWAHVHGNYYGTSRQGIQTALQDGRDILLEIDWQGALQIKKIFPQAILIFILPPSWEELKARLQKRGEDSPEVIEKRLNNAQIELAQAKNFDFVIINDIFETALSELNTITQAQRLRYEARKNSKPHVFQQLYKD
ncbi:MAG: guanylate kinase [Saezia sp.]